MTAAILAVLRQQPTASRQVIAQQIGNITSDGVKYRLARLTAKGAIRRVGAARTGRWEVLA